MPPDAGKGHGRFFSRNVVKLPNLFKLGSVKTPQDSSNHIREASSLTESPNAPQDEIDLLDSYLQPDLESLRQNVESNVPGASTEVRRRSLTKDGARRACCLLEYPPPSH